MYKGKRAELREASRAKRRNNHRYFITSWIMMLRNVMAKTGRGYRTYSLKNDGAAYRRADKLERSESRLTRQYRNRYAGAINAK